MGNCLRTSHKISTQHDEHELPRELSEGKIEAGRETTTFSSSELVPAKRARVKKMVGFKLQEDDDNGDGGRSQGDSKSGLVRIKVVVTQEELRKILNYKNDPQCSSLEQLLGDIKLRGRRISKVGDGDRGINTWKPALESIAEDQ
ncbi:DUF4228 domain-containing protein [Quillaja saponaria]|uniref:DUF4228 domain-containing protein n=1 Tax=Quillaja saponaria TaxID=32244 RepID=A0AAD7KYF3_QUISA|nr:DUF4228 domain-containing protein [Quillaja saponaria]